MDLGYSADEPAFRKALPLTEEVVNLATALVCAEAAGAIRSANDATLDQLKTRKQFERFTLPSDRSEGGP
jgi:alkylation response protein AidB-like acyl-CoA dehydrogenase